MFFDRLIARGHSASKIHPIFKKYIGKYFGRKKPQFSLQRADTKPKDFPIFFHIKYHPMDPPSSEIQKIWKKYMMMGENPRNPYRQALSKVKNKNKEEIGINRLIVCYHRHRNLKELLSPRKFDSRPGPSYTECLTRLSGRGR